MGTRTQRELEAKRAEVAALEVKAAEEDAALALDSPHVRQLAVALHTKLCPDSHDTLECSWFLEDPVAADDPEGADWTAPSHSDWLRRARGGLATERELGWRIYPPGSSEPLPTLP
ncbi:MAG TPA: hypothetical protein VFZ09_27580 [Archangium sp.]|uniref:hypothetical protein n=1 Tax=Archangium sp. TaxID=1872627 RepID=UPI002E3672AE|nr:hypothetical protein [Archangium sp.]HEX5750022.1 hypothetical protein [Archangium sp.]